MSIFTNIKVLLGNTNTPPPQQPTQVIPTNQKKVAVIEDDQLLSQALVLKLQAAGFSVFAAANGEAGLQVITTQKPDLVLLDLMMPVMDGKTMLHRLRNIPEFKTLPVYVLTNAGDVDNMQETTKYYDAEGFIIKSNTDPDEIVELIKKRL